MTTSGQIADALIAAAQSNKAEVLAALSAAEGGLEAAVVAAIKNAPKPGGLLGIAFPAIEASLVAEVQRLIAQNGPEVIFDFLAGEAQQYAKSLGG